MYGWLKWIIYIVVISAAIIIPFLLFIMSFDKIKIKKNQVCDVILHLFFFVVLCVWYYGLGYSLTHYSF